MTVNPAFLSFFNAAAAFGETIYADGGQDPHFSYSLKPEPSEGVQMLTLRVDGQTLTYTAGGPAAFKKFTWQGSGTHEAMLSVRFGNTDLGFARGEGLWAAFHLFQKANQSTATGCRSVARMDHQFGQRQRRHHAPQRQAAHRASRSRSGRRPAALPARLSLPHDVHSGHRTVSARDGWSRIGRVLTPELSCDLKHRLVTDYLGHFLQEEVGNSSRAPKASL